MLNKLLVEFLGTAFFLYVIVATGQAIPIGLALILVIMVGGKISGGHFNPAVSVMMMMNKKITMGEMMPYILAQVAGGLFALEVYKRVKL